MRKELIISIFIILLVVIGDIITQNYTKECVKTINSELAELKTNIIANREEDINSKINEIGEKWEQMHEKLSYYIEHDELEKVETQFFMLKGDIEMKEYEETMPELEKCLFILEHIEDKTAFDIKNIF